MKTKKEAILIAHTLSNTSKMPGLSYSLPANKCKIGAKLRKVKNSVCSKCYAHKGCYSLNSTQTAMERRYNAISTPLWSDAMVTLIQGQTFFRWHDSGDIQSLEHLTKIVDIAKRMPDVNFWLPTKEKKIILDFVKSGKRIPKNLVIRLSAAMINGKPPTMPRGIKFSQSITDISNKMDGAKVCNAPMQNGECKDCRACWNKRISTIAYLMH